VRFILHGKVATLIRSTVIVHAAWQKLQATRVNEFLFSKFVRQNMFSGACIRDNVISNE